MPITTWARRPVVGASVAGAGLAVIVAGTFLPWLRSGEVLRDSYQTIGALRAIGVLDGNPVNALLDAWTMVVPVITACLAGYALGLRRTAATIASVLAIICGTVATSATVLGGAGDDVDVHLGITATGPVVTLAGAVLTVLGATVILAGRPGRATGDAGGEP